MSQFFVFHNDEGGVALGFPTPEALETASIHEIAKRDTPPGKSFWIINKDAVPNDDTFYDAWELDPESSQMIKINVDKAKEIHNNVVREVRKPLLEKLDVDFTRALEEQKDTTKIVEQKQKLRNVTNIVSKAKISSTNVDEVTQQIKNLWDESLLGANPYK